MPSVLRLCTNSAVLSVLSERIITRAQGWKWRRLRSSALISNRFRNVHANTSLNATEEVFETASSTMLLNASRKTGRLFDCDMDSPFKVNLRTGYQKM